MSEAVETSDQRPPAISGDMNGSVPTMPARANVAETSSAASGSPGPSDVGSCPGGSIVSDRTDSPKSVTLGSPSAVRRMLPGLRSRWSTPGLRVWA